MKWHFFNISIFSDQMMVPFQALATLYMKSNNSYWFFVVVLKQWKTAGSRLRLAVLSGPSWTGDDEASWEGSCSAAGPAGGTNPVTIVSNGMAGGADLILILIN